MKNNIINEKYDIISMILPNNTYSSRNNTKISLIILHSLGLKLEDMFGKFEALEVSAHYLITKFTSAELKSILPEKLSKFKPKFPDKLPIIKLVRESEKAHHAGKSNFSDFNLVPECEKGLNPCSIGIEFHTEGYANYDDSDLYKFTNYSEEQKKLGIILISHLMKKYNLPKENLLAHSTISVGRKTDPGPLFFWKELEESNLGYLPKPKKLRIDLNDNFLVMKFIQEKLFKIGFVNCPQNNILDEVTKDHINAYIMQFAPNLWKSKEIVITQELIDNINGFDQNIIMSS